MAEPIDRLRAASAFSELYDCDTWKLFDTGEYAWVGSIRRAATPDFTSADKNETVVLKIYRWDQEHHRQLNIPRRIQAEANLAAKVRSTYVIAPGPVHWNDGIAWLEMPFIDGVGLHKVHDFNNTKRRKGAPISHEQLCAYAHALFSGLNDAHRAGIVHRDIKPQNLLVPKNPPPALMILDFGIAKTIEDAKLTSTTWPGTPWYAASEVFGGSKPGPPGDVFSAALVLYELACGAYPWDVTQIAELRGENTIIPLALTRDGHLAPMPPRYYAPELNEVLGQLLIDCLATDPSARPTAAEALRRLASIGVGDPIPSVAATPPLAPPMPAPTPRSRRGLLTLVFALAVAGALGVFALGLWVISGPRTEVARPAAPEVAPSATPMSPTPAPTPPLFDLARGDGYIAVVLAKTTQTASDIELTLLTRAGDVHTATVERLEPGQEAYLWPARWTPPLAADAAIDRIQVRASLGQERVQATIVERSSSGSPLPRDTQALGAEKKP